MRPVRALIVDDEPLARENLRLRLRAFPEVQVLEECATGESAVKAIAAHRPDLVFLDIQMPDLSGFEVLERVPADIMPVVVFVTAYDRYALEAFRVHALDYLLKPFNDERFAETLRFACERLAEPAQAAPGGEPLYGLANGDAAPGWDRLVVRTRGRVFFLRPEDIDWVESNHDYARLHVGAKSYLVRRTMGEMETRLARARFVRVNRTAIVSVERIEELRPQPRGGFLVRLAGGTELKLTRTHRQRLEALLGERF